VRELEVHHAAAGIFSFLRNSVDYFAEQPRACFSPASQYQSAISIAHKSRSSAVDSDLAEISRSEPFSKQRQEDARSKVFQPRRRREMPLSRPIRKSAIIDLVEMLPLARRSLGRDIMPQRCCSEKKRVSRCFAVRAYSMNNSGTREFASRSENDAHTLRTYAARSIRFRDCRGSRELRYKISRRTGATNARRFRSLVSARTFYVKKEIQIFRNRH